MTSEAVPGIQHIDYPQHVEGGAPDQPLLVQNKALLDGIKVKLSVVVGQVETTLGELLALREAAVLKTDRLLDQRIDVVVNGEVVARGHLVAVDDHFGIQVTEIAAMRA